MAAILSLNDDTALQRAADELRSGKLVAFPTDTVYGLASLPTTDGVRALYRAKARPSALPIPVLLADVDLLPRYAAAIPSLASVCANRFWPGPLTLVLLGETTLAAAIGASDGSVGLRVPGHAVARRLIALCGGALAVTSANLSGGPDPLTGWEVEEQLGREVAIILQGGPPVGGRPSTVLDFLHRPPRILRAGPLGGDIQQLIDGSEAALPR